MTTRGQLPKAYLRIDPNIDRHKADTQWAFIRLLCEANRQPRRGRFKNRAILDAAVGRSAARRVLAAGDAVEMASGEVVVPGWDEWQEGDVTVAERQRRIRHRREFSVSASRSDEKVAPKLVDSASSTALGENGGTEHKSAHQARDSAVTSPLPDRIPTPAAPTPLGTSRGSRSREGSKARRGEAKVQKRVSPQRARTAADAAGASRRSRQKAPPDRPDLAAYAKRGWRWSDAQADDLGELALQLEVTREQGLATLADWITTAPTDVPDLHGYILELGNRTKADRAAKADEDEAAWERTKAAYAEGMPASLTGVLKPMQTNGKAISHEKAIDMLRQLRGTVEAGPWRELLARYGVTEEELDAAT